MDGRRIVLVITSVVAVVAIASAAAGCGVTKKSGSTTANTGTGRPDTKIAYFEVLPSKQMLRQGVTSAILLQAKLSFKVAVTNDGDQPLQNVKVTLKINQHAPFPTLTRNEVIPEMAKGVTALVDFGGPYNIGTLIRVVPIRVEVHPVAGEMNAANNIATYKVRFHF